MEYNINQLDNAIFDLVKDYENQLIRSSYVHSKLLQTCPSLNQLPGYVVEQRVFQAILNINQSYKFIYPLIIDNNLYVAYSNWSKTVVETNFKGYVPDKKEIGLYVDYNAYQSNIDSILLKKYKSELTRKSWYVSPKTMCYVAAVSYVLGVATMFLF